MNQIVEYEVHLNQTLQQKCDDVVCWTYDLSKFSASMIMDILRTHPVVLIGEVLHRNALFVSSGELQQELGERESTDNAGACGEGGQ